MCLKKCTFKKSSMENKRRICLVDDHVLIRNALRELIEKLGPYKVVSEFDDGADFLAQLNVSELPELVLMDLSMPKMSGLEVMQKLAGNKDAPPILILTLNEEEHIITQLFRLGARGYLTKNVTPVIMKEALEDIFSSGYYHNDFMKNSLRNSGTKSNISDSVTYLNKLSVREREFLKLVCHEDELTYDQIADKMKIQPRTIDGYRESIFFKFGIRSKTGMVLFVLKNKLYELL
jgi:two-component system, NarL family, invasion response regulator UvrY